MSFCCDLTAEYVEKDVHEQVGANKVGKPFSRWDVWMRFLMKKEGKRLSDLVAAKKLLGGGVTAKEVTTALVKRIVAMYGRLNDLHHYQVSSTLVEIVEGPLTAQECQVLACMAEAWNIMAKVYTTKSNVDVSILDENEEKEGQNVSPP